MPASDFEGKEAERFRAERKVTKEDDLRLRNAYIIDKLCRSGA